MFCENEIYWRSIFYWDTWSVPIFSPRALHMPLFKNRTVLNFGDRLRKVLTSFLTVKFAVLLKPNQCKSDCVKNRPPYSVYISTGS